MSSSLTSAAGGSTTTITAVETVTGWHVLKVEGYSKTKGVFGVCGYIYSGTFSVDGHYWSIRYHPDSNSKKVADWISVSLYLNRLAGDQGGAVNVRFQISLLDQKGEPVPSYTKTTFHSFPSADQACGYSKFIKRVDLESSYLDDDSFQIRCDVTVIKDDRKETNTVELITVPPPDLHRHLGDLYASQVGVDVTFEVGGKQFKAHRNVLAARSPVFMAELYGPMEEKTMSNIQVTDIEARVFKAMLHFIYTDSLPEIDENDRVGMVQYLLVAADKYGMKRLKSICETMLLNHMNTSTVATTLALAEQHGCHGLKEGCFMFLRSPGNMKAVVKTDSFQNLKSSCPSIIDELLVNVAP
ncbi:unnamed protein product [Urochloa decumbens]|uniref:Uncharacterized protein n=1 Tax=Urochloa decumbens TaxID=240449 RepID=A0ABC9B4E1_9POAL